MSPTPLAVQMGLPNLFCDCDIVPCVKARVAIVNWGNQQFVLTTNHQKTTKICKSLILVHYEESKKLVIIWNISESPLLMQSMNTIMEIATRYWHNVQISYVIFVFLYSAIILVT